MIQVDLSIGGYAVQLQTSDRGTLLHWPIKPFDRFLSASVPSPDIRFTIHVVKNLPVIDHGPLLFDACHGLWKLFEAGPGLVLEATDTKSLEPRSRSRISADYSSVEVWLREQKSRGRTGWLPMHIVNPIVEVCLLTMLAREGGLFLHASGPVVDGECLVFTGPSGAGKSTMAGLFASQGASVLSDERLMIRQVGSELRVFGTPWIGNGAFAANTSARLSRLFCISHGRGSHMIRTAEARRLSQLILEQCFLPHWDRAAMAGTLAAVGKLIEQAECAELAFLKTPDVVNFIQRHELAQAVSAS